MIYRAKVAIARVGLAREARSRPRGAPAVLGALAVGAAGTLLIIAASLMVAPLEPVKTTAPQWQVSASISGVVNLSAIACPSMTDCYVVGYGPFDAHGVIVATTDGGATCVNLTVPSVAFDLLGIACPSDSDCYVTGQNERYGHRSRVRHHGRWGDVDHPDHSPEELPPQRRLYLDQ
jgi:hypothetical protein